MAKSTLHATSALNGFHQTWDGVELSEVTNKALVSIAVPLKGEAQFQTAMKKAFEADVPETGASSFSKDKSKQFLGLQKDQLFAVFDREDDYPTSVISEALSDKGYYTDQSDSWVVLRLQGIKCRKALERICPLNLHQDVFAINEVARTTMEHLAAIIVRDDKDSFILMSPRSSAHSFLHAIETSVKNIS